MQILYVTDSRYGHRGWLDPSARHRVFHYADCLASSGYPARVVHIEEVTASLAARFNHIIFHRPKFTKRFETAFEICQKSPALLHADYDDLIFDPDFAQFSPLYLNGNRPLGKVKEYFQHNQQAAVKFDNFLVSTRNLSGQIKQCFPGATVSILPNALPRLFKIPERKKPVSDTFTIGYFPGSNSHSHDLNQIGDAMAAILNKFDNCRLVIAGRFNRSEIKTAGLNVRFVSFLDYRSYLSLLSMVDLSIAPLENNPFNAAKSAVKLIESVAVATPILVTRNLDMEDHHNSLSTIVDEPGDWAPALENSMQQKHAANEVVAEKLENRFNVCNRLPLLKEHLLCAA